MTTVQLSQGIRLHSGALFNYNEPDACDVAIQDIAHALSNICRFAGHCRHFYSVAQHAVNCSYLVEPEHAFDALMHDTAEAFTNDIPTPLKVAVPMFKDLEVRIETAMSRLFNFTYPLSAEVKLADLQMLGLEKNALLTDDTDWAILAGIDLPWSAPVDLTSWPPSYASYAFLTRYEELSR